MTHRDRRWRLTRVASAEELARRVAGRVLPLCAGFCVEGREHLLFLNDAAPAADAQWFAVVVWHRFDGHRLGLQVEFLRFSLCSDKEALSFIREALTGQLPGDMAIEVYPRTETPEEHGRCPFCS